MNKIKGYAIILLLLSGIFGRDAFSITIYVSPKGKDTNTGTAGAPFATLEAARDYVRKLRKGKQLNEPAEIIIAAGTYFLTRPLEFNPDDSGTRTSPLIIKGKGKETPVFSGGIKLPAFQKVSEGLWKVVIPQGANYGGSVQQLFVNGIRAVRARTPNDDTYYNLKDVSENILDADKKSAVQKIPLTAEELKVLTLSKSEPEHVIVSINHAWDRTRKYIQRVSVEDSSIYIAGKPMQPWNRLNNSAQFYFENAKEFLDQPGEFFYDPSGTLFYIPRAGERLETASAIVPVIEQLLTVQGTAQKKVENVHFQNLSFQYTNHLMPQTGEEPAQAAASTEGAVMIDYASNIYFERCEISHTGNNAIWFRAGCKNGEITNCYFHDLGIGGLKIGEMNIPDSESRETGHIIADNNIIRSGGHEIPTGIGVLIFQSGDNTISHNEIADFRYSGISVGWVWGYSKSPAKRNKVVFNHIHHLGWGLLSDMGGVYTLGLSEGTTVSNNVIHDIYSFGYGGWGLYTDEGSTGILEENNLVYNCKNSGFHQHYGQDNIIRNNIFAFQIKAQLQATRLEDHRSFFFTNNIIYFNRGKLGENNWDKVNAVKENNIYWDTSEKDLQIKNNKNSLVADPLFADPLKYDFHFKNNSVIRKINFKPFDYTKAGVYGSKSWKKLAEFDAAMAKQFSQMVERRLSEGG